MEGSGYLLTRAQEPHWQGLPKRPEVLPGVSILPSIQRKRMLELQEEASELGH